MKRCLITGATGGLGQALARQAAAQNLSLILAGRDTEKLSALSEELSSQVDVMTFAGDLSNEKTCQQLLDLLHTHPPDLIINNAGFGLYGEALKLPLDQQQHMIDLNIKTLVTLTIEAAKQMQRGGTILNISSAASFFPFPTFALYAATKSFVNRFSLALDAELKHRGIRILVSCPGQIKTGFRNTASRGYPQTEDGYTLSPKKAAALIFHQIKAKKRLQIIDWRYRLAVCFSKLLPLCLLQKWLKESLSARFQHPEQPLSED